MSDRITLRIGNTTPDDLEIQRFLRLLGQKNLSRQSWIKHAMILGFTQLEKEIGSTDARAVGQHGSGKRHASRRPQNAQGRQNSGARDVIEKTEKTVEPNDNGVSAPSMQTLAGVQPLAGMQIHAPQPVAASSHPVQPPLLSPQPPGVRTLPENRLSRAAPETSGNTETVLQTAVLPAAGQMPSAGPALLTEDELRFSSTTVEQARKLMGSFGKGYDG